MGYSTEFRGQLSVTPPLTPEQLAFITAFNDTRRMGRDNKVLMEVHKGEHGLPGADKTNADEVYGKFGEYYVGDDNLGVFDQNAAPGQSQIFGNSECQPGLWCGWTVYADDETNQTFEHDGGEKFYNYVEWLQYMIKFFFIPWGVMLNGEIDWRGEDWEDNGVITVVNNNFTVKE
jgi:hypothetical protein